MELPHAYRFEIRRDYTLDNAVIPPPRMADFFLTVVGSCVDLAMKNTGVTERALFDERYCQIQAMSVCPEFEIQFSGDVTYVRDPTRNPPFGKTHQVPIHKREAKGGRVHPLSPQRKVHAICDRWAALFQDSQIKPGGYLPYTSESYTGDGRHRESKIEKYLEEFEIGMVLTIPGDDFMQLYIAVTGDGWTGVRGEFQYPGITATVSSIGASPHVCTPLLERMDEIVGSFYAGKPARTTRTEDFIPNPPTPAKNTDEVADAPTAP